MPRQKHLRIALVTVTCWAPLHAGFRCILVSVACWAPLHNAQRFESDFEKLMDNLTTGNPTVASTDCQTIDAKSNGSACADTTSRFAGPSRDQGGLIGRTAALDQLQHAIEMAKLGSWKNFLVTGAAGSGKTSLIQSAAELALENHFIVLSAQVRSRDCEEPNGAWLRIIGQLIDTLRQDPELCQRLVSALQSYQEEVATGIPSLGAALGFSTHQLSGPSELRPQRIVNAFGALIAALGSKDRPVMISIDGCEMMDDMSFAILKQVTRTVARHQILLVGGRADEVDVYPDFDSLKPIDSIRLDCLSDQEIGELCQSRLGDLPREAIDVVCTYSDGFPGMAAATLDVMVQHSVLEWESGEWTLNAEQLCDFARAGDSRDMMLREFASLDDPTQEVLEAAAACADEFTHEAAVALTKLDPSDAAKIVTSLEGRNLLQTNSDGKIQYSQRWIRDAVLGKLSDRRRRDLHANFGEFLQASHSHNKAAIAYHYDAADLKQEALPHALSAAKAALRCYSLERALDFLEMAAHEIEFADHLTRHSVEVMFGDVLAMQGKLDEAENWFREAEMSASSSLNAASVVRRRGDLAFKSGNKGQAVVLYEMALRQMGLPVCDNEFRLRLSLAGVLMRRIFSSAVPWMGARNRALSPSESLQLQLYDGLVRAYWFTRDKHRSLWAHLKCLSLAELQGSSAELSQCYAEHAPVMSLFGRYSRGLRYAKQSLEMRRERNDLWGQGQAKSMASVLLYSSSQFAQCIRESSQAISFLTRTGDFEEVHAARYQLAAALLRQGKLRESLDQARSTYQSCVARKDYQAAGNILDVWARASLGNLPHDVLLAELDREIYDPQRICQIKLAQGVNAFHRQQYELSIAALSESIEFAEQIGFENAYTTSSYSWLASALREQLASDPPKSLQSRKKRERQLQQVSRKALEQAKRHTNDLPHALRELAAVCGMLGQSREAERLFSESMTLATKQDAQWEKAQTILMHARYAKELGWSVDEDVLATANKTVKQMRKSVGMVDLPETLKLMDRFDILLEHCRKIAASTSRREIRSLVARAAGKLLRGERAIVIEKSPDEDLYLTTPPGNPFDPELVRRASETSEIIVSERECIPTSSESGSGHQSSIDSFGTFVCAPIKVDEKTVAFLYVANTHRMGLCGEDEVRIASHLTHAAGVALDQADQVFQLQERNRALQTKLLTTKAELTKQSRDLQRANEELQATREGAATQEDPPSSPEQAESTWENYLTDPSNVNRVDSPDTASHREQPPNNWMRKHALEFAGKVEKEIASIHEACDKGDFDEVIRQATWIKGTGGHAGLSQLSQLALNCERSAKQCQGGEIAETLDEIQQHVEDLLREDKETT